LHSGSWIDSDFHIWIGDPVKNRAWDLLVATRKRVAERETRGDTPSVRAAIERILPAEGSDWFWWFGGPFSSAEDAIFDRLFRAHLEATYRALGEPPPIELSMPIDDGAQNASVSTGGLRPPTALIRPAIGNERGVRGYFAWHGAGVLDISRGAAMAELPLLSCIRYGFDHDRLVLRLEATPQRADELAGVTVDVELSCDERRYQLRVGDEPRWQLAEAKDGSWHALGSGQPAERGGAPLSVSLGVPWQRIAAQPQATVGVVVRLVRDALVLARYPSDGALTVTVPGSDFEANHWTV
jgi:hypothetical protein